MKKIFFACLSAMIFLAACGKKDVPAPGDAHVRFANAVQGSGVQDVYVDNELVSSGKIGFSQQTPYYLYTSGIHAISFTNTGTTTLNALLNLGSSIGDYATVFYYKNASGLPVAGATKDDMTAPPAGKARVRFVQLNNLVANAAKVSISGGADLTTALTFGNASAYYNVDPGAKFIVSAPGVTTAPEIDLGIQAGKIYNIWLSGPTATELYAYGIVQNY